jgi:hypothetical protein
MGCDHIQFNSMYVPTLKVAKNCHALVSGPKFAGIAQFGNVATNFGGGGGGSTGDGGGSGKCGWCPPPPVVDNNLYSGDSDDE